jgi:hypothetical protein
MTPFLSDLGGKLFAKWLALGLLPSIAGITFGFIAAAQGQAYALNVHHLVQETEHAVTSLRHAGPTAITMAVTATALAATALAALAKELGTVAYHGWLEPWPRWASRPQGRLISRRQRQWDAAQEDLSSYVEGCETSRQAIDQQRLDELARLRDRIAPVRPARATWMADRLHGTDTLVFAVYGLDLATAWPRLWLIAPPEAREIITDTARRLLAAAILAGWAALYTALAIRWWPAALIAIPAGLTAWRRGRSEADAFAELVHSVTDVYLPELVSTLLGEPAGKAQVSRATGLKLTAIIRKNR